MGKGKVSQKKLECENCIIDLLMERESPATFENIRDKFYYQRTDFNVDDICWSLQDLIKHDIIAMKAYRCLGTNNGSPQVAYVYKG